MEPDKPEPVIEKRQDGTTVVRTAGGAVLDIGKDRNASLELKEIEAVGIRNLIEVESHQITRVLGSTSHFIRFHDGGEVRFAYNHEGKLIELSAQNCGFSLTSKNELLFMMKAGKAP